MQKLKRKKNSPRATARKYSNLHGRHAAIREIPADSLSKRVYQALKRDIITGVHLPGDALSEKDLARQYSSSRTPVREAAVRLQQDHLLKIVPNRGYFITKISVQDLTDLYDYRAAVECACAELASMKGMNPALLERLEALANTEYRINDRASYENFISKD